MNFIFLLFIYKHFKLLTKQNRYDKQTDAREIEGQFMVSLLQKFLWGFTVCINV